MKNSLTWILAGFLVAGLAGIFYYRKSVQTEEVVPPSVVVPRQTSVSPPPTIRYPVPSVEEKLDSSPAMASAAPVPKLDESDPTIEQELGRLFGRDRVAKQFLLKDWVRRFVVTVENMKSKILPAEASPFKALEGEFRVSGNEDELIMSPTNERRYAPYLALAQSVDAKALAAVYVRFYPVFQEAYRELGSQGYFNDRVVDAIEHLLNTPKARYPLRLVQVGEFYKFQDSRLEALSGGQKALLRLGPEGSEKVQAVLRQLHDRLTRLSEKNGR